MGRGVLAGAGGDPADGGGAALDTIAACLRENTDDFTCVDRILHILETLGYSTVPRHDFG